VKLKEVLGVNGVGIRICVFDISLPNLFCHSRPKTSEGSATNSLPGRALQEDFVLYMTKLYQGWAINRVVMKWFRGPKEVVKYGLEIPNSPEAKEGYHKERLVSTLAL
jgi:hypothetical protein